MLPTPVQISAARALLGLSSTELARALSLHPTSLRRVETGLASPQPSTLLRLVNYLGTQGVEFRPDGAVRYTQSSVVTSGQLRAARVLLNLTQRDVAYTLGGSHINLANIELGKVKPRLDTFTKLVDFYTQQGVEFAPGGWIRLQTKRERLAQP